MKIVLNEDIKAYMNENNISDLEVDVIRRSCWSGSYEDISASFADKEDRERYAEAGFLEEDSELGKVYFSPSIRFEGEEVGLTLKKFLWSKSIDISGIRR